MSKALYFFWNGHVMIPRRLDQCQQSFVPGETYRLVEDVQRSDQDHAHYFAMINTFWENIPESYPIQFRDPDEMRDFALIEAGFFDTKMYPCRDETEAERWAVNLKPKSGYSKVEVVGETVVVKTAQSQSYQSMGKKRFQDSKHAVLGILENITGISVSTISANAGHAA